MTKIVSISVIDFFCGCGGTSAGLRKAGMKIVAGVDFDEIALKTYARNFPKAKIFLKEQLLLTVQRIHRQSQALLVCCQSKISRSDFGDQGDALLECSEHPRQKFTFAADDQSLRLAENQSRCITVACETVPAGPWVKRPLQLETCDGADPERTQWTVVTE